LAARLTIFCFDNLLIFSTLLVILIDDCSAYGRAVFVRENTLTNQYFTTHV
jgi:hypothetical protein